MGLFGNWLGRTRKLQQESYGTDPNGLLGDELTEYIRWNTLAAHTELSEFLQETPWKPWSTREAHVADYRNKAIDEMVDVLHFAANLLCALDCSDEELNSRYEKKMNTNRARAASGTY